MSSNSSLYSISFQLIDKSALPVLDGIKLTFNITSMTIRSYHPIYKNSESDSEKMMGFLVHLSVIRQILSWCHIGVGIIHLLLVVFLNLLLLMVMVEVV